MLNVCELECFSWKQHSAKKYKSVVFCMSCYVRNDFDIFKGTHVMQDIGAHYDITFSTLESNCCLSFHLINSLSLLFIHLHFCTLYFPHKPQCMETEDSCNTCDSRHVCITCVTFYNIFIFVLNPLLGK